VSDHHSGLSRVRAARGARATAGPAETAADSHSESIAVRATASRESARHAAHIILACWASRSGSARVWVRSCTRANPHVSSAATSIIRRRDQQIDASRESFLTSSNTFRCKTECSIVRNVSKIAYNNYAYVSQWEETFSRELISWKHAI